VIVTLAVSAKHVNDDYANYYYSVSPGQSAASGLPIYQAHGLAEAELWQGREYLFTLRRHGQDGEYRIIRGKPAPHEGRLVGTRGGNSLACLQAHGIAKSARILTLRV
jgi:hypothetical protein